MRRQTNRHPLAGTRLSDDDVLTVSVNQIRQAVGLALGELHGRSRAEVQ